MTVNTISSVAEFDTNGVTTNYPFYFKFLANEDLVVTYVNPDGISSTLTLGTQYTVNGAGNDAGGSVVTTTALAGPGQLVVSREMDAYQQTSLRNQGKFLAETHEDVFDRLTMLIQQGFAGITRALKRPVGKAYFDAEGRIISNVADPVVDSDATTKGWAARYFGALIDGATGLINTTTGILYDAGTLFDYLRFGVSRNVDSVAALRLLSGSRNQRATVLGYYAKGDGGGGSYFVDPLDTTSADNGGTVIVATDGARWKLTNPAGVTAKQFGAKGDGTTDVTAVLAAANAAGLPGLTFTPGLYLVSANFALSMPVLMHTGARFIIPTGVTLTFSDSFSAPVGHRFACAGTGKVVFGKNSVTEAYPEWWGATTNLSTDASAAVTAALIAAPGVVQLQAADYYATTSFKHQVAGKTLRGTGSHWANRSADSTRLISMSGATHALIVGPDTQPATINDFPQGIKVENLLVTRSVAPVIASGCAGVLSRWTLFQTMDDVKSAESMHGFQYTGTVQARTDNAHSFRSIAGTGGGTDFFRGFWIDGTTVLSGVAGGNASVHWDRCVAGCVLAGVTSYGMYVNGAWADTFIRDFEASVCTVGVYCQGDTQSTQNYKTVDLHIINPIIDQFSFAGIFVDGTSPFATISINGGYVAPVGTGTPTAGVYVYNSKGAVNISGGFQYICGPNTSMTAGLLINNSRNVDSIGSVIAECSTVGVLLLASTNCRIMDRTINYSRAGVAGCQMSSASNRNYVALMSSGGVGGLQYGVQMLADTNNYNEINATGIDPAVLGVTKIQRNGAAVVATGLSGTNMISGVIA